MTSSEVMKQLEEQTGVPVNSYAEAAGTGWKLVTIPVGRELYAVGPPGKTTMKWGVPLRKTAWTGLSCPGVRGW